RRAERRPSARRSARSIRSCTCSAAKAPHGRPGYGSPRRSGTCRCESSSAATARRAPRSCSSRSPGSAGADRRPRRTTPTSGSQMTIKSDRWITRMAREHGMIEPFEARQVRATESGERKISYGVSSYGYDVRCADEFKIFTNINTTIVDPKNFDAKSFVDFKGDCCIIPPNSFALARTVEYFRVPRNVLIVCLGKSTYARCGVIVNVTPLEPEWEGHVTLEFSNTTPL